LSRKLDVEPYKFLSYACTQMLQSLPFLCSLCTLRTHNQKIMFVSLHVLSSKPLDRLDDIWCWGPTLKVVKEFNFGVK